MKSALLVSIVCLFFSCQTLKSKSNEPIAKKISEYVRNNCLESKTCQIKLKETMDFSWDKLYVFDMSVEQQVLSSIIGEDFSSSSPYYSNKMFFTKGNKVVDFEQHLIPEVDNPFGDGDVDFEIKDAQNKYTVFNADSIFKVERIKTETGEFYRLHCINCENDAK